MVSFEQDGVVSLWVFREEESPNDVGKDVLKDFCGVDSYDSDFQEGITTKESQQLSSLVSQLSYSTSFINDAINAAERIGIKEALGVIAQYNFAYDPSKVSRELASDPVFIGYFKFQD